MNQKATPEPQAKRDLMGDHTPTPWKLEGKGKGRTGAYTFSHTDAAFIVRACNAHYQLVAAAEIALAWMEEWGADRDETRRLRRAVSIAKAEGSL